MFARMSTAKNIGLSKLNPKAVKLASADRLSQTLSHQHHAFKHHEREHHNRKDDSVFDGLPGKRQIATVPGQHVHQHSPADRNQQQKTEYAQNQHLVRSAFKTTVFQRTLERHGLGERRLELRGDERGRVFGAVKVDEFPRILLLKQLAQQQVVERMS